LRLDFCRELLGYARGADGSLESAERSTPRASGRAGNEDGKPPVLGIEESDVEGDFRRRLIGPTSRRCRGPREMASDTVVDLDRRLGAESRVRADVGVVDEGGIEPAFEVPEDPGTEVAQTQAAFQGPEEAIDEAEGVCLAHGAEALPNAQVPHEARELPGGELRSLIGHEVPWPSVLNDRLPEQFSHGGCRGLEEGELGLEREAGASVEDGSHVEADEGVGIRVMSMSQRWFGRSPRTVVGLRAGKARGGGVSTGFSFTNRPTLRLETR